MKCACASTDCVFNKICFVFTYSTQQCHLYVETNANQWPIVYSDDYNIGFLGLERLHPFDSGKWGKVFQYLKGISIS